MAIQTAIASDTATVTKAVTPASATTQAVTQPVTAPAVVKKAKKEKTYKTFGITKKIAKITAYIYYPVLFGFWLYMFIKNLFPITLLDLQNWHWWLDNSFLIFCTGWAGLYLLRYIVNLWRVYLHYLSLELNIYIRGRNGDPGTGKTSSGVNDAVWLARKVWLWVCFKYWTICWRVDWVLKHAKPDERDTLAEVVECYRFYRAHKDLYPCLGSSIGLKVGKRTTLVLTEEHLQQVERMVPFTVWFIDEFGDKNAAAAKQRADALLKALLTDEENCARYTRHFGFWWLFTEPDKDNALLGIRRVCGENRYLKMQKAIMKPPIISMLFKIFQYIISRVELKHPTLGVITSFGLSYSAAFVDQFLNTIGFRKYKYYDFINQTADVDNKTPTKKGSFILLSNLNCSYDERGQRRKYKARNQPLKVRKWTSLVADADIDKCTALVPIIIASTNAITTTTTTT